MSLYAADTECSSERSEQEIRRTLLRYGADDVVTGQSSARGVAMVQFVYRGMTLEARIPIPPKEDAKFTLTPSGRHKRSASEAFRSWEQACRQQWRVLVLLIKAKLEAVENGLSAEQEFMSWILLPSGQTVGSAIQPNIKAALAAGHVRGILATGPEAQK